MLSSRAQEFLASLDRQITTPLSDVREQLSTRGISAATMSIWLDFHERFAGYVEQLGADKAVWGLANPSPEWGTPGEIWLDDDGAIVCADAHPSYDYTLLPDGHFLGPSPGPGPCSTFEVKIEQTSLIWAASRSARWQIVLSFMRWEPARRDALLAQVKPWPVLEATDAHSKVFQSDDVICFEGPTSTIVWIRSSTAGRWGEKEQT